MILFFMAALAANVNSEVGKTTKVPPNLTCKTYISSQKDCNYCVCKKCTDGKTQWDTGECTCSSNTCPVDQTFWGK